MAFTIPLSSIAGSLAMSFTVAAPEPIPVQAPRSPAAPADDAGPAATPSAPPALPDAPPAAAPHNPPEAAAPSEPWPEPSATAPMLPGDLEPATEEDGAEDPPRPQLLAPSEKRSFFSLSTGGATEPGYVSYVGGGGGIGLGLEMLVGRYGKRRPNLGGAFVLQYRKGLISDVSLAGRFRARKQLTKAFSLYTVFDATLGVSVPIGFAGYLAPSIPNAQIGVGWGLEAILADRVTLGVRPFAPNVFGPSLFSAYGVGLRWDFGASIGIVW